MRQPQLQHYINGCKGFNTEVIINNIFNKEIQKAHKQDYQIARKSYSKAFEKYLDRNSVLLDIKGNAHDTIKFSNLVKQHSQRGSLKFFIAGAYGFDECLLRAYPQISLSPLTFSHEIAKLVLLEQIYRALSIINNHPYHKN
ncbi:23S rRNA (pseudouridine(1915)-N(3))-methyltransferase RlmH [Helicobacter didelphidarum]|uniref:23S rRNA (pseudouridine(1915)-N(3))-methyltransferase RlmH n=1 Tax=Helicobacter didelphidarum TaxID=2040648 RepID=UPI001FEC3A8D|nr:23S rRNA (pseudouridine(1915)-N(3))-methyltransferase RlmH [Helicobacter didelphidarum]